MSRFFFHLFAVYGTAMTYEAYPCRPPYGPTDGEWTLDCEVTFLNHGSFGACPRAVQEAQAELRSRMEREPVRFFLQELEPLLDAAREEVAAFVGAAPGELALVRNATSAVNSVLSSLPLVPRDEILLTDHTYNACGNAVARAAERTGARVVLARVPFPLASADEVFDAVMAAVSSATRLALLDHVTSPTGLVFPIGRLVAALAERGIDTLVDGAHAPGMVPLDLEALGAAYYTGNLHKWCCSPKGAAFLYVRRDRQPQIHPAVTSHGRNSPRTDRSRFLLEFDWVGSDDYTAVLTAPAALRYLSSLRPGGFAGLMAENRQKALSGRRVIAAALAVPLPCPDEMIGALASLPLPDAPSRSQAERAHGQSLLDPLQVALYERHAIQVPVVPWPASPRRLIRISAQAYNRPAEYEKLAAALVTELDRGH